MTPDDVEARLQALRTPMPPDRLRERCLAPRRRPRAAWLALGASFLMGGLSVWLIAMPKPPSRPAEKILPPVGERESNADDPVLKDKADRLRRENPGMAILVVRVRQLQEGQFLPLTQGFGMKILLEPTEGTPDPLKDPGGPYGEVDLDGNAFFVSVPGRYRGVGFDHVTAPEALQDYHFAWEYKDLAVRAGELKILEDAIFARRMAWAAPPEGGSLSLKSDGGISWAPYPELRQVRIGFERVTKHPDAWSWEGLGTFKGECPKDSTIHLSQLSTLSKEPFRAGETLAFNLEGFDRDGRKITQTKERRLLLLRE
jgi:hypothetical protein